MVDILAPSLTGDGWKDLEWTELRIVDNLKGSSGTKVEVTVDVRGCQRYVWVDSEDLKEAGLELTGLHLGVYMTNPLPRPLGLVVETDNDVKFIPFYYPKGEYL